MKMRINDSYDGYLISLKDLHVDTIEQVQSFMNIIKLIRNKQKLNLEECEKLADKVAKQNGI